ncbi:MAG: hypothetical protein WCK67_10295 [bacterium]
MSNEIENIQKILIMKSFKKEYFKTKHNPIKDDFEKDDYKIDDYLYKSEDFSF